MKHLLAMLICTFAVSTSFAASHAGAPKAEKELTPQQALMKRCQADATASGKKGPDRQKEVNTCLGDGKKRQQEKMKACNADLKDKKGDERKKLMSECLKK
jgi:hypothetical protein